MELSWIPLHGRGGGGGGRAQLYSKRDKMNCRRQFQTNLALNEICRERLLIEGRGPMSRGKVGPTTVFIRLTALGAY